MQLSSDEKDIGVVIVNKLNFEKHIVKKVNKANSIMGVIKRTFQYMEYTSETTCGVCKPRCGVHIL